MASGIAKYYLQQGTAHQDIGRLHHQPIYLQRGSGIGGVFATLIKYLTPLASSGLSVLKEQAIRSGKNILDDISTQKPFREILKDRGREVVSDLTHKGIDKIRRVVNSKQSGGRYIKRSKRMIPSIITKATQSRRRNRRKRITKKIKQIGGRRRKRRQPVTKKRRQKRTRTLDIFN